MSSMAKLTFGRLTEAWTGEAADFTPLLSQQLDGLGAAIGVDLAAVGASEVLTDGGRRIDIVAQDGDGSEFVVENQYGRADHDHLTRGLAYAVARRARGLIVVAESHRDEFRAVAQYLNELAEHDTERGIFVWLVEAKAVRIDSSPWAPLFTSVVEPNSFTANVEQARQSESASVRMDRVWDQFAPDRLPVAQGLVRSWVDAGYRTRPGKDHVVLEAPGPSANGHRSVVAVYADARVMVPFHSYAGANSGIPIEELMTDEFRSYANELFGFGGTERLASTASGWLTEATAAPLLEYCNRVAAAYSTALEP